LTQVPGENEILIFRDSRVQHAARNIRQCTQRPGMRRVPSRGLAGGEHRS